MIKKSTTIISFQLEDAEFAKTAAIKARQSAESDLSEINSQLEEALRYKNESEDKCARMCKEKAELQTQVSEDSSVFCTL